MSVLFEPAKIASLELRNRFVRSATVESLCSEDGRVTEAYLKAYERLAKGGVGLIVPGNFYVSRLGRSYALQTVVDRDEVIKDLARVVSAVQGHGVRIVAQLNHGGRQADPKIIGRKPLGPSAVRDKLSLVKPREMTEEEILSAIEEFAQGARRMKEAGFDGVQIHAAHGYLINQFLSSYTNRRKDRWGGSLENRMRFLVEVYKQIRAKVGEGYPILVKINAVDYAKGGVTVEQCVAACRKLEELGIAAIEVSGGIAEKGLSTIKGEIPMDLLLEGRRWFERAGLRLAAKALRRAAAFEEGYFLPLAAEVKRHVKVPVLAVGGMRTLARMEEVVEKGWADFISLCRPLIRQPNLVRLFEEGRADASSCTSCNRCSLQILLHRRPMKCYQA